MAIACALLANLGAAPRPVAIDRELQHLGTEVTVTVDGDTRMARFEIQERFRNVGGRLLEADYLYPIPDGAVFTNLSLLSGETELRGEMLPADDAREIYEEIVRRAKDPALVELAGHGLVRARVFPIEPGQTREVILRYSQVLPREAGSVRLEVPRARSAMVPVEPAPRQSPIREEPIAGPGIAGAIDPAPLDVRVRVAHAAGYARPFSPTHSILVERPVADELRVRLAEIDRRRGHFELLLPLERDAAGATLLAHSVDPAREEGHFLLLITPPDARESGPRIPRDVTLVLDTSGSMSGHKLEQARNALRTVLRSLGERDRFRVIAFSSVVRAMDPAPRRATPANVQAAIEYLDGLEADGNTNVHEALTRALEPTTEEGRLAVVLFLTDGLPTVSETDPERIAAAAARLRDGERIFAFGVGADVNTYLLDRLVDNGRGAVAYVRPQESVEGPIASLTRKIGTPALADLRIVDSPVELKQLYPEPLPDLFYGEELVLLGRYREGGSGRLEIMGRRDGRTERLTFDLDFPERRLEDDFVARLWATRKAAALATRVRLHGPDSETVQELRELGLRYGVLTEYTSYLVQEPDAVTLQVGRLEERVRSMVAEPSAQTGEEAFRRARAGSWMAAARTMDEAEEALKVAMAPGAEPGDGPGDASIAARGWARAGRRLFVRRDGLWHDVRVEPDLGEIAVEPYGDAWFDLLRRFPGLHPAVALGEGVIIGGDGLALRLGAGGATRLTEEEWRRIAAAFAGDR